jgi:hypothetical protein
MNPATPISKDRLLAELSLYQCWQLADKAYSQYKPLELKDGERVPLISAFIAVPPEVLHDRWLYLRLWCGCLCTVIEGWEELQLHNDYIDSIVDELRSYGDWKDLKRFRNGIFHYQQDPRDDRFWMFMTAAYAAGTVRRCQDLHLAFGAYFRVWADDTPFNLLT